MTRHACHCVLTLVLTSYSEACPIAVSRYRCLALIQTALCRETKRVFLHINVDVGSISIISSDTSNNSMSVWKRSPQTKYRNTGPRFRATAFHHKSFEIYKTSLNMKKTWNDLGLTGAGNCYTVSLWLRGLCWALERRRIASSPLTQQWLWNDYYLPILHI